MSRYAYVNGRYLPFRDAKVHVEDRGYQFADGVYEVCEVRGGRLIDERRHMARLQRSLAELRIRMPTSVFTSCSTASGTTSAGDLLLLRTRLPPCSSPAGTSPLIPCT